MIKNRANPQRSRPPGNPSSRKSETGAECPQMSANVRRIENFNLSHRQQDGLPVMVSAPSLAQATRWAMSFAVRACEAEKLRKDIRGLEHAPARSNSQYSDKYQNSNK